MLCMPDTANPLYYYDSFKYLYDVIGPFRNYSIWRSLYEHKAVVRATAQATLEINDIAFNCSQLQGIYLFHILSPIIFLLSIAFSEAR